MVDLFDYACIYSMPWINVGIYEPLMLWCCGRQQLIDFGGLNGTMSTKWVTPSTKWVAPSTKLENTDGEPTRSRHLIDITSKEDGERGDSPTPSGKRWKDIHQ
jgi:hypothetical protein